MTIHGTGFCAHVRVKLDSPERVRLDRQFVVTIGETLLETDAVRLIDAEALYVRLPPTLPLGLHDATVVTPLGQRATLAQALEVYAFSLCADDADCAEGQCIAGFCQPAECGDGVVNGDETAVDCGGSVCVARCVEGQACVTGRDCTTGDCLGGLCQAEVPGTLQVEDATLVDGQVEPWGMTMTGAGDSVCWDNVDLTGITAVEVLYSNGEGPGDSVDVIFRGSTIGNIPLPHCGTGGVWGGSCATASTTFPPQTGTGTLCLVGVGVGWIAAVNWLRIR